jgi:hypothetical protein
MGFSNNIESGTAFNHLLDITNDIAAAAALVAEAGGMSHTGNLTKRVTKK